LKLESYTTLPVTLPVTLPCDKIKMSMLPCLFLQNGLSGFLPASRLSLGCNTTLPVTLPVTIPVTLPYFYICHFFRCIISSSCVTRADMAVLRVITLKGTMAPYSLRATLCSTTSPTVTPIVLGHAWDGLQQNTVTLPVTFFLLSFFGFFAF